jgi:hypothetical protein
MSSRNNGRDWVYRKDEFDKDTRTWTFNTEKAPVDVNKEVESLLKRVDKLLTKVSSELETAVTGLDARIRVIESRFGITSHTKKRKSSDANGGRQGESSTQK